MKTTQLQRLAVSLNQIQKVKEELTAEGDLEGLAILRREMLKIEHAIDWAKGEIEKKQKVVGKL